MSISIRRFTPAALAATAALLSAAGALAQTTVQLRYLELRVTQPFQVTNTTGTLSTDGFNNGAPLSGISHQPQFNGQPNGAAQTGSYAASGTFTAGAELPGAAADFLGTAFGVGSLALRLGDAAPNNTNLTPAGATTSSISMRPVNSTGNAFGLITRSGSFDLSTVWNFSAMQAGESLVMGITGSGGTDYVDRLQIRYGSAYGTGTPFINFETQSSVGGVLTRTAIASIVPTAVYATLSAVDYIGLELDRDMPTAANPNPAVRAHVVFFDAALDGTGGLLPLADVLLGSASTFTGSGDFQGVYTQANWNTALAVPEPAAAALMALGLAGLLIRRRAP